MNDTAIILLFWFSGFFVGMVVHSLFWGVA
jgi:hypothetical protein